jgi:hypothetical protein
MPSITNGVEEGKQIGTFVAGKLKTKAAGTAAVHMNSTNGL